MAGPNIDDIDLQILGELQNDGRMTNVELARKVGLTAPPCLRRCLLYTSPSPRD